jgi:hypothetical protein
MELIASVADGIVQFMHQTARDFLIQTIPNASNLKFKISDKAHRTIIRTWVGYLIICFTSPIVRDSFSKIESWGPGDFRTYVEYLNQWPLIEYTLRYIKDHHDRCGQKKIVSRLVNTLVQRLTENHTSYFLGSWIALRFGQTNSTLTDLLLRLVKTMRLGQSIHCHKHQTSAESFKCNILDASAELRLSRVSEALLLLFTQGDSHAQSKTHLIICAQKGLTAATRLLLELNMDKDSQDDDGRTALHYAAENGDEGIVTLLVDQGAKNRIMDKHNKTALHLAIEKL